MSSAIATPIGLGFPPDKLGELVERFFSGLRCPIRKNLRHLVSSFVTLTSTLRSCNGELSLASVARALPLPTSFRDRYKRLNRLLDNPRFDPQGVSEGLFGLVWGQKTRGFIPIIVDQSSLGRAQLLMAGTPFAGRTLPLGLMTFTYEDIQTRPDREKSQNFVERLFFLQLLETAPEGCACCFILDRGYARVSLMQELLAQPGVRFVLRTRRNVVIEREKRGRSTKCAIGSLKAPAGRPRRLPRIRYRGTKPIEVDLLIYYEPGHKEPWYLLLPPGSSDTLPDHEVVAMYRRRMRIEQGFRDFKTHLGLSGLRLQVRVSERTQRLLLAFTLAYSLVVALGTTRVAEDVRERLESSRRTDRHGTSRILSARSVAALMLCGLCIEILSRLAKTLDRLANRALAGEGLYHCAPRL